MTEVTYVVTKSNGEVVEVPSKSKAEKIIIDWGGSYKIKLTEKPSSSEAYCKKETRAPGSRT